MSLTKSTLKKTLKPLSQVIARKDLLRGIVSDLCLLHGLGVRLVVALGTKPQVDGRLSRSGAQSKFVDGYRVTDAAALSAAVEASLISRRGGSSNNSSKNASSPPLLLAVRSSAAAEDLAGASAAGLYDSVLGVDPRDANQLGDAVAAVWASLFSRRAVLARRGARLVPSKDYAAMAVIVQEMAPAALSFVLHTRAPGGGSGGGGEEEEKKTKELLAAEVAVGAGEALASAERGSPWRLSVDRATGAVEVSSFANLSRALLPSSSGNASLSWRCVDYSRQPLSLDPAARERLARKLLAAGLALEASFGGPQDVEGCLPAGLEEEGRIWIVQARPQPGA